MLILCIDTKILPNLIFPTVLVAHQEVVGGAFEWTRHARARVSNVLRGIVFARVQYARSSASSASARLIYCFLVSLVLACCTPFTAALASTMGGGNRSDDRDPAGSGKTRGATWKYDSSDIKLGCRLRNKRFWIPGKTADWWSWATTSTAWQPRVKTCACKSFSVTKFSLGKIIHRKSFRPRCAWAKKANIFSRWKFPAIRYLYHVCYSSPHLTLGSQYDVRPFLLHYAELCEIQNENIPFLRVFRGQTQDINAEGRYDRVQVYPCVSLMQHSTSPCVILWTGLTLYNHLGTE